MSTSDALPTIACPNCREQMQARDLEHNYHGAVRVELCFTCAGIWFDHLGSVELAPGAVMELFREIHAHLDDARRPVAARLDCPRCSEALELGFDLCKAGRFTYFRCRRGDGRFTPFFQFLREKQFVRSLTPVELQRVRSQVRQIRCSECGAPIDLEHSSQCQYCHAPVSFLDPDAVEKALRMWSDLENRRHHGPTPEAVGDALLRIQLPHAARSALPGMNLVDHLLSGAGEHGAYGTGLGPDLIAIGIRAIGALFARGRIW
ncbi:MAG: zf-TFIIB domain-containing protein [Steroidobacteraceae bacterium]|jgi:hypothetical protein